MTCTTLHKEKAMLEKQIERHLTAGRESARRILPEVGKPRL